MHDDECFGFDAKEHAGADDEDPDATKAGCSTTSCSSALTPDRQHRDEEHEAADILSRLRAAREAGDVGAAQVQLAAAESLLGKKTRLHGSAGCGEQHDNALQGKLRKQLAAAMKLTNKFVLDCKEKDENEQPRQKNELKSGSNSRKAKAASTAPPPNDASSSSPAAPSGLHPSKPCPQRATWSTSPDVQDYVNCFDAVVHKALRQFVDWSDKLADAPLCRERPPGCPLNHASRATRNDSLQAVFEHRLPSFRNVHLPGATADDWCTEPDITRQALYHVALLLKESDRHCVSLYVLQAFAVSFFAQAIPSAFTTRENIAMPAIVAPSGGSGCGDICWTYLFWDSGNPVVVTFLESANARRFPAPASWLWTSKVATRDVLLAGQEAKAEVKHFIRELEYCMKVGVGKGENLGRKISIVEGLEYGGIQRGFFVMRNRPYLPSLVDVEQAPFIAFEIVDFDRFLADSRREALRENEMKMMHGKAAPETEAKIAEATLQRAQLYVGESSHISGLRKEFMSKPNSGKDLEFYGNRDDKTGELLLDNILFNKDNDKNSLDLDLLLSVTSWNWPRMNWLMRLGERKKRACFGTVFQGADSDSRGRAHALQHWITLGDSSPHDQQAIDALEGYLFENGLVGTCEEKRRCVTGRIPFALPKAEDAVDKYLENLFWEWDHADTADSYPQDQFLDNADEDGDSAAPGSTPRDAHGQQDGLDLNAEKLLQAALIGCDDPDAIAKVLRESQESGSCILGCGMEDTQARAAALLADGLSFLSEQDATGFIPSTTPEEAPSTSEKKPKIKTRGVAGRFKLASARMRAQRFREQWEEETGTSADDAMRRSVLKAGGKWEDAAGPSPGTEGSSSSRAASRSQVDDESTRLARARSVLGTIAQKRMRWRNTKRGLAVLCQVGLLSVHHPSAPSGNELQSGSCGTARPQLLLNCRGSHRVLHGPRGAATLVKDHKGNAALTGKQFVQKMERIIDVSGAGA